MKGSDFAATFLQAVFQEQVDRHAAYKRLVEIANKQIETIDIEITEIDLQLVRQHTASQHKACDVLTAHRASRADCIAKRYLESIGYLRVVRAAACPSI